MDSELNHSEQDVRPNFIKKYQVDLGEIEYNGQKIPYTILKKELEPALPGFLAYKDGANLFISEEVPEKFRVPQLIHEIIEFTELNGKEGRCVESLKRELLTVPDEIRQEYIEYRKNFFANLIEYYKNWEDENFKAEITASYEFLQSAV